MKEREKPADGEIEGVTDNIRKRFNRAEGRWEYEITAECTVCGIDGWMLMRQEGYCASNEWHVRQITGEHKMAFCPRHTGGRAEVSDRLWAQVDSMAGAEVEGMRASYLAEPLRPGGPPRGMNPAGIYSQSAVQWLASLPTGKPAMYWGEKKELFPDLAAGQGRMNFPDLIEARVWTVLFRHADMTWSMVGRTWRETAKALRTPYPFSDPRFMETPRDPPARPGEDLGEWEEWEPLHVPRLDRLRESLDQSGGLPARWNLTRDMGLEGRVVTVLADERVLGGEPHAEGTEVTLRAVMNAEGREKTVTEIADAGGVNQETVEGMITVGRMLRAPGWPYGGHPDYGP